MDKRSGPRRPMDQTVAILRPDGSLVCECKLLDVSESGARLRLAGKAGGTSPPIDDSFILSLTRRGNLFRNCQLIWREGGEIGVRFVAGGK